VHTDLVAAGLVRLLVRGRPVPVDALHPPALACRILTGAAQPRVHKAKKKTPSPPRAAHGMASHARRHTPFHLSVFCHCDGDARLDAILAAGGQPQTRISESRPRGRHDPMVGRTCFPDSPAPTHTHNPPTLCLSPAASSQRPAASCQLHRFCASSHICTLLNQPEPRHRGLSSFARLSPALPDGRPRPRPSLVMLVQSVCMYACMSVCQYVSMSVRQVHMHTAPPARHRDAIHTPPDVTAFPLAPNRPPVKPDQRPPPPSWLR
jgi:hypothetical protein